MISINHFKITTKDFCTLYPAFGYALSGIIFSLASLKIACIFVLFSFLNKTFFKYALFGFLFSLNGLNIPQKLPNQTMTLKGVFYPEKTVFLPNYFKTHEMILGTLKTKDKKYQLSLFIENKDTQILGPAEILVNIEEETAEPKTKITILKNNKKKWSLFGFRQSISSYLYHHLYSEKYEESSKLLYALLTGSLDHKLLKVKFSTFGLAHILALSGFHLSLLSGFCYYFLKPFTTHEIAKFCSMLVLAFYFLYVGPACSITRAFSMSLLGYIHSFFSLKTKPFHTFCLSLIATTLICQQELLQPSFILTFSATLALICFNPVWQKTISILPENLTLWEKFIFSWLKLFCLQLFIFIFTLPSCLFHFKKALSISIFYNLFFPTLISIFMILGSCLALLKSLFDLLGNYLIEKTYLYFDYCLKALESPYLSKGIIIDHPLESWSLFLSLIGQFLLVFHLFKKNRMI